MNTASPTARPPTSGPAPASATVPALTLAAIGVVFGDIGTSPLYTVREVFGPAGVPLDPANVIGAVSAIVWALMLVVTLKYVLVVLRADHHGEGGVLALAARAAAASPARRRALWMALGLAGATLFYADSLITPAISVLGAMEGLQVLNPAWSAAVVPLSVLVLLGLFALQRHGTAVVGRAFGPVIVLWFLTLAVSGLWQVLQLPDILQALDPRQAWHFLWARGPAVLLAVGAIVLALTGAEALYADMGHFGRTPIRIAWTGLVLPALALNYLGQGALLLRDPAALDNPFYRLFPEPLLLPALLLATLAAIIASQAVISGAYSMTRQAIQLGYLPRLRVRHTSASTAGQIYMPGVNAALLVGVVLAVLWFGSSSALAAAYGVAVTLTMLVTTVLVGVVARADWGWPAPLRWAGVAGFLVLDGLLVSGCLMKLHEGGWMPLALGGLLFVLMRTWSAGRRRLLQSLRADGLVLDDFVQQLTEDARARVPRTAVYPVADPALVPQALLHNLKHNQVLHARNVVLTVRFEPTPQVDEAQRCSLVALGGGFWRATLHCGFMEEPDVPAALARLRLDGERVGGFDTSYFLSRETVVPGGGMARWREHLFVWMSRNAGSAANYFGLPDNAVVELGTRVQV